MGPCFLGLLDPHKLPSLHGKLSLSILAILLFCYLGSICPFSDNSTLILLWEWLFLHPGQVGGGLPIKVPVPPPSKSGQTISLDFFYLEQWITKDLQMYGAHSEEPWEDFSSALFTILSKLASFTLPFSSTGCKQKNPTRDNLRELLGRENECPPQAHTILLVIP